MRHQRPCPVLARRLVALGCVLVLFVLPVAAQAAAAKKPARAAAPLGGDSPEAVMERARAAAKNQDMGELAACLAPSDRAMLSMMLVAATGMMVAFGAIGGDMASGMSEAFGGEMTPEQKAKAEADMKAMKEKTAGLQTKYDAILAKHGLKELMEKHEGEPPPGGDPGENAAKLLAGVDQVALITDLNAFMDESFKSEKKDDGEEKPGMKVPTGPLEGLKVEGDKATGKVDGEEIRFVKVDGRWFMAMPEEKQAPEKPEGR